MILRTMERPIPLPPLEEFLDASARKNWSKIAGADLLPQYSSVIFDLNLDEITHIFDTDADIAFWLIHIFDRVSDNIVNDSLQLLCIGDHKHIIFN